MCEAQDFTLTFPQTLTTADLNKMVGYDNHAFDSPARSRKVSGQSEHTDIGPTRKKSMNQNHANNLTEKDDNYARIGDGGGTNGVKKHSTTDSIYSKTSLYSKTMRNLDNGGGEEKSWWYVFFLKCRSEDSNPSWQPNAWPRFCPYPFCPTYRQFSRIIALVLIGILAWCILYSIVGEPALPPDGTLYQLIVLCIGAFCGGWLMSLTTLPALIGMLITGILFQNIGIVNIDERFATLNSKLRQLSLVILLIRAGLDLDPQALKRMKFHVIKIGLIPWVVEAAVAAVLSKYLLRMPWDYACLLASIVAAVSPAVVVSALFRLRVKGYGVAKGIPTLIIAIAGVDDAISVAIYGIIKSIMFSDSGLVSLILQGPISILGGIGFGILWGVICYYTPEKQDPFMVPLRILLLLVGGTVTVFGSELIGYGGAGPLACVAAAFTCLVVWMRQGWDIEDNPAATAFQILWIICEPILFGITGAQVKFNELDRSVVYLGAAILIAAILLRMVVTVIVAIGCNYNMKEKVFLAFALMAKATVQAALGPSIIGIIDDKTSPEYHSAKQLMMVCILSIIITAPTGAILITLTGPKLLTKGKTLDEGEGRRSHRPSIRDITIINEGMEDEERNAPTASISTISDVDGTDAVRTHF